MRFVALAADYDETLAEGGSVRRSTEQALERLRSSGRKLVLVTGRQLDDLLNIFPRIDLFHAVVVENGAVLYRPVEKKLCRLAEPPPLSFSRALRQLGIPVTEGQVIVATRTPYELIVLEEIKRQGLELQVVFNKGAVMVLPSGVNKATGFARAICELHLSTHNAVAVGDAENDHVFLAEAELGAAVANAVPTLCDRADVVLRGAAHHGVEELIEQLLQDDLRAIASRSRRRDLLLGESERGRAIAVSPASGPLLFAGTTPAALTAVRAFTKRLLDAEYQCCILDPNGNWPDFERAVQLGDSRRAPSIQEVVHALSVPSEQIVVNLVGLGREDRPRYFSSLLKCIQELRGSTGRPHWLVVDEAQQFLSNRGEPANQPLIADLTGVAAIARNPIELARPFLERVTGVLAAGPRSADTLAEFFKARRMPAGPLGREMGEGEALFWQEGWQAPTWLRLAAGAHPAIA
jgi:hydroxymethylpyrimidine pyrophosphatase-like HAD family hydrolase